MSIRQSRTAPLSAEDRSSPLADRFFPVDCDVRLRVEPAREAGEAGPDFLGGESGMAGLTRAWDGSGTTLGPVRRWPASLKAVVGLMLSSKLPMYIACGPELALLYNDACARLLGSRHPAALGRSIAHVWADAWNQLRPAVELALEGRASFGKDVALISRRGRSRPDIRYYTHATSPIFDDSHRVAGVFCVCRETTAAFVERQASRLETERLRILISEAPSFMAVLQGPDHVVEVANAAYLRIVGRKHLVGRPIREALSGLDDQGLFDTLDRVFSTGEPVVGKRALVRWCPAKAGPPTRTFLDFVCQPLRDAAGQVTGIFLEGNDVTEAALADERRIESERFARATIDALAERVAVVDATGRISAVNKAWREFGLASGADPGTILEGSNYLDVCDSAMRAGLHEAGLVADLIRQVASGIRLIASFDYPCPSPSAELWFSAKITRFAGDGPVHLVISHQDITERRRIDQKIAFLATHDPLTGLPNRALFSERASQSIARSRETGIGLALLFIDLEQFKRLNDAQGHMVGDAALVAVAAELRALIGVDDTVARIGGDEFVVILTGQDDAARAATRFATDIKTRLGRPLHIPDRDVSLTASVGISLFPADGDSVGELLRHADAAMYVAKSGGRNDFVFFSPEMGVAAAERLDLENHLARALALGQLDLHYQPQVKLASGTTVGVEALLRWRHPNWGLVPPATFIPIAEESGLILAIGEWVLRSACAQNKAWQEAGLPRLPVAVNISPAQLRQAGFVESVSRVLAETRLDPGYLELEITESMVMSRTESMVGRLKALRALGVLLSIDDFGTGYSNLGYLTAFPLDRLKIDQSFIRGLPSDPNGSSIVGAIVAMGRSLGLRIMAEGVETAEQVDFLRGIGCDDAQGFLYGRPTDAAEFERLLREGASHSLAA